MMSYKLGSVLPLEEDSLHEFKGHRNLAVEELPRWAFIPGTNRRSRTPVSRALNGFLNTGGGGTVYLGVTDEGVVKGLYLNQDQIDHVRVSLADLMSRYCPRVSRSRYKVAFCPVEGTRYARSHLNDSGYSSDSVEPTSSPPSKQTKAHVLRTSTYCWCDRAALALYNQGVQLPIYVIEIRILPFVPNPSAHEDTLQLAPVYQNEEGTSFLRKTASNKSMKYQEIAEFTRLQARNHFEKVLRRQRSMLVMYQNLYTSLLLSGPNIS
ncbi:schlafen-like protein 2 [Halichondria panicea]|uniref:schlafen-like protein 2 n=1 Tax=Halichondria panicea TaxID=6063 RepID=UPI00312BC26A